MAGEADKSNEKPQCPQCGNRLRVLADQLGTTVRCPKCNATFTLGGPTKASQATSVPETTNMDAYQPKIPRSRPRIVPEEPKADLRPADTPAPTFEDEAYEPEIQLTPSVIVPLPRMADASSARQSAYHAAGGSDDDMEPEAHVERPLTNEEMFLESARKRGLVRSYEMPATPRWTFFSGVFGYPWRGINLTRWTAMSFGLSVSLIASVETLEAFGLLGGSLTSQAVGGIFLAVFTIVILLVVLSFAACSCHAAIQDTADGHDLPQEASLPDWDLWVFTLLGWVSLWAAAGAIGFPLSLLIGPSAFLITGTLLFPVLLLSAMESGSYLLPYSPPVLRTLGYYFHGWLMFHLLTIPMAAGWIVAFVYGFARSPYLTLLASGPAVAAIMLIYARLLGRLAWRASGAPPAAVEVADKRGPAKSQPKKPTKRKKRSKIRIEIPDEVEPRDVPGDPPPRINFHLRP